MGIFSGFSFFGLLLAAIAAFMLGWFWYSPKGFGEKWAKGVGLEWKKPDQMPALAMAAQFGGLILFSLFVSACVAGGGYGLFLLGTLAFGVLNFSGSQFRTNSIEAGLVEGGYWLAAGHLIWIIHLIL